MTTKPSFGLGVPSGWLSTEGVTTPQNRGTGFMRTPAGTGLPSLGPQLFPAWEDSTSGSVFDCPRRGGGPDVPVSGRPGNPRKIAVMQGRRATILISVPVSPCGSGAHPAAPASSQNIGARGGSRTPTVVDGAFTAP